MTAGERRNKDTWRSRQEAARGPGSALKPRLRRRIGRSAVSAAGKATVRPRVLGLGPASSRGSTLHGAFPLHPVAERRTRLRRLECLVCPVAPWVRMCTSLFKVIPVQAGSPSRENYIVDAQVGLSLLF